MHKAPSKYKTNEQKLSIPRESKKTCVFIYVIEQ